MIALTIGALGARVAGLRQVVCGLWWPESLLGADKIIFSRKLGYYPFQWHYVIIPWSLLVGQWWWWRIRKPAETAGMREVLPLSER